MVTKILIAIQVIVLLVGTSCLAQTRIPKRFRKQIINCCNERPIHPLPFRTDGIYFDLYLPLHSENDKPIPASFFILFDDGTVYRHQIVEFVNFDSLLSFVVNSKDKHIIYGFKDYGGWGRYMICGDTVTLQTYSQLGIGYVAGILNGKLLIKQGEIYPIRKEGGIGSKYIRTVFVPYRNLPNPNYSWFRRQPCIECEEKDKLKCE